MPRAHLAPVAAGGWGSSWLWAGLWMAAGGVTGLFGQHLVPKQLFPSSSREKVMGLFCIIL